MTENYKEGMIYGEGLYSNHEMCHAKLQEIIHWSNREALDWVTGFTKHFNGTIHDRLEIVTGLQRIEVKYGSTDIHKVIMTDSMWPEHCQYDRKIIMVPFKSLKSQLKLCIQSHGICSLQVAKLLGTAILYGDHVTIHKYVSVLQSTKTNDIDGIINFVRYVELQLPKIWRESDWLYLALKNGLSVDNVYKTK